MRPNGSWEGRYRGADGRQRSVYATTERLAAERLRRALNSREDGLPALDQRLTVAAFLDAWIAHHVTPSKRPRTVESYTGIVELYLKPSIGHVALAKLQSEHVQSMLAHLEGRRGPISQATRRYVYSVLRIAMGRAVKMGKVHRNVCTMIDPPVKSRSEMRPLSRDEVHVLLDGIQGDRLAGESYPAARKPGFSPRRRRSERVGPLPCPRLSAPPYASIASPS
jgi:hypothetical protein